MDFGGQGKKSTIFRVGVRKEREKIDGARAKIGLSLRHPQTNLILEHPQATAGGTEKSWTVVGVLSFMWSKKSGHFFIADNMCFILKKKLKNIFEGYAQPEHHYNHV